MNEQPDNWQLIAQGETLKQEGQRLIKKYPQHAAEIRAMLADIDRMRAALAEMMLRAPEQETRSTHDVIIRVRKGERRGQSYHKACYSPDLDDPAYWTRTCFSEACRPTSVCTVCGLPLRREVPIP